MKIRLENEPIPIRTTYLILRGVLLPSLVFMAILMVLVTATFVQLQTVKPLESQALSALKIKAKENPEDKQLQEEIRAFDLLARKAYFTSITQVSTGGYLVLFFAALSLASFLGMHLIERKYGTREEPPEQVSGSGSLRITRTLLMAFGIIATTAVLILVLFINNSMNTEGFQKAENQTLVLPPQPTETPIQTSTISRLDYEKNWPGFRGPYGNGKAYVTDAPVEWDLPSGKGVLWKMKLPKTGSNSPVVWDKKIFYTAADKKRQFVTCVDADKGQLLWETELKDITGSPKNAPKVNEETGYAAPSCATDGKAVYAIFANGNIVALDFSGKILWARNLGSAESMYGYASSPIACNGLLYIQYDQTDSQRVLALHADTGENAWETKRDMAASWASPALAPPGTSFLVMNASPLVTCYDPLSGKELWSADLMFGDIAPSPSCNGKIAFFAMENAVGAAIELATGKVLFQTEDELPNVASPLVTESHIYLTSGYGVISCLDAEKGSVLWTQEFEEGFYASPILANGNVYYVGRKGTVLIFPDSGQFAPLSTFSLKEDCLTTPAFTEGRIFLKTTKNLICVGR